MAIYTFIGGQKNNDGKFDDNVSIVLGKGDALALISLLSSQLIKNEYTSVNLSGKIKEEEVPVIKKQAVTKKSTVKKKSPTKKSK